MVRNGSKWSEKICWAADMFGITTIKEKLQKTIKVFYPIGFYQKRPAVKSCISKFKQKRQLLYLFGLKKVLLWHTALRHSLGLLRILLCSIQPYFQENNRNHDDNTMHTDTQLARKFFLIHLMGGWIKKTSIIITKFKCQLCPWLVGCVFILL